MPRQVAGKIPSGEVLTDGTKQQWVTGAFIGQGGFGRIYSASMQGPKASGAEYVIKIVSAQ